MNRYKVTVNGKTFEVLVEETGRCGEQTVASQVKTGSVEAAPSSMETKADLNPKAPVAAGGIQVTAPLSGSIFSLAVKPGEEVSKGQVLLTLEALKMENEIVAPESGKVESILVQIGATVNAGDLLLTIRETQGV